MSTILRVLIADDERPARAFLGGQLRSLPDVEVVAEAADGREALEAITECEPDLALLDLNMPEIAGLDVARMAATGHAPAIAFVTAHDEFAVEAFELNAVDYLLKPVERDRLAATLDRVRARASAAPEGQLRQLSTSVSTLEMVTKRPFLERIPVRRRDDTVIVPVRQIVSIVAERELLHLTTATKERHTITYRLHALESRLDPRRFVRLGRGAIVAVDSIRHFNPLPGGSFEVALIDGQKLIASRIQSRLLRDTLLKL